MSCAKSWVGLSLHLTLVRLLLLLPFFAFLFQENHNHTHNQGEFTLLRLHFRIFTFCFTAFWGFDVVTCSRRQPSLGCVCALSPAGPEYSLPLHSLGPVSLSLLPVPGAGSPRKSVIRVLCTSVCVCVCAPQTQKMFTLFTPLISPPGWTTFYCPFALSPPAIGTGFKFRTFPLAGTEISRNSRRRTWTRNRASPQKPTTTTN